MSSLIARSFELDEACRAARSIIELEGHFSAFVAELELGVWRAILLARGGLGRMVFASGQAPSAWAEHYAENNLDAHDIIIDLMHRTAGPVIWHEVDGSSMLTREAQRVFSEARAFGLVDGITAPVRLADGEVWVVATFARHPIERQHEMVFAFEAGARSYLRRLRMLLAAGELRSRPGRLTKRQREVLARLAAGARQSEIADELGVSVKAVEAALAEARGRYGAPTTVRLIVEAVVLGEIDVTWADLGAPREIPRANRRRDT